MDSSEGVEEMSESERSNFWYTNLLTWPFVIVCIFVSAVITFFFGEEDDFLL